MTREETKKIIMIVKSTYPNWNPDSLSNTIDAWNLFFEEYSYNDISLALKTFVLTDSSGFAPSVGQIIENTRIADNYTIMNETVAWGLVSKALRDSTYHAEEQFQNLPELVQRVVGSPMQLRNWGQTNIEAVETVIQSNFIKTYRAEVLKENQREKAPMVIRQQIKSVDTFVVPQIADKTDDGPYIENECDSDKRDSLMDNFRKEMDG